MLVLGAMAAVCLVMAAVVWKLWILRLDKATLKAQIDDLQVI
jgi:hypothetical protein